ncbi:MAG: B12-binding domain-containing radical SAM protein, partial [Candidatus Omnitrophica bacterium]|nr:B12-binding domain-containing radical SAM protein [Candidatus Omnitrophota bacterium]MBU1933161.1 B12-binding domain-containing radical SAM protein [Candidatus Omnitrophota bacterium]
MKILLIDPNLSGMISQNVGLAYVISSVEQRHRVKLLDLTFQSKRYNEYILAQIEREKPDLVGLSVTSFSLRVSMEISELIKRRCSEIRIIWGGGYPTLFPEESISSPSIDAICIGEGEISALEYLNRLEDGSEPNVEGIWYKDKKGLVHKNRLRPFEENIDNMPFPNWDHWKMDKHLEKNLYFVPGAVKFLASRGCPYSCSFCSNDAIRKSIPGRYYRQRTPQNIIEEIKINESRYWEKGFRVIHFADEIFGLNYEFLKDFCRLFKKEGLDKKFSWCCATRADVITEDWARTAADSGCVWIWLGIESGDDYVRNGVYKKNITGDQIIGAVSCLRNNGIAYNFSIMVGCPEDTRETIEKSIRLAKALKPATFDVSFYQPLPKTELGAEILRTMKVRDIVFDRHVDYPRIRTKSLSISDLNKIMWKIRLIKLYMFLFVGLKSKKIVFILDI